jgi:hypothetical protein
MTTQRREFIYTIGQDLPKFLADIATQGWLIDNGETRMASGTETIYVAYRDI